MALNKPDNVKSVSLYIKLKMRNICSVNEFDTYSLIYSSFYINIDT